MHLLEEQFATAYGKVELVDADENVHSSVLTEVFVLITCSPADFDKWVKLQDKFKPVARDKCSEVILEGYKAFMKSKSLDNMSKGADYKLRAMNDGAAVRAWIKELALKNKPAEVAAEEAPVIETPFVPPPPRQARVDDEDALDNVPLDRTPAGPSSSKNKYSTLMESTDDESTHEGWHLPKKRVYMGHRRKLNAPDPATRKKFKPVLKLQDLELLSSELEQDIRSLPWALDHSKKLKEGYVCCLSRYVKDKALNKYVKQTPVLFYKTSTLSKSQVTGLYQRGNLTKVRYIKLLAGATDAGTMSDTPVGKFADSDNICPQFEEVDIEKPEYSLAYFDAMVARLIQVTPQDKREAFEGKISHIMKWVASAYQIKEVNCWDAIDHYVSNCRSGFKAGELTAISKCSYGFALALCANRKKGETLSDFEKRTLKSRLHYFGPDNAPKVWSQYLQTSEGQLKVMPKSFKLPTAHTTSTLGAAYAKVAAGATAATRVVYETAKDLNDTIQTADEDISTWTAVKGWFTNKIVQTKDFIVGAPEPTKSWVGATWSHVTSFLTFPFRAAAKPAFEWKTKYVNPLWWLWWAVPLEAKFTFAGRDPDDAAEMAAGVDQEEATPIEMTPLDKGKGKESAS